LSKIVRTLKNIEVGGRSDTKINIEKEEMTRKGDILYARHYTLRFVYFLPIVGRLKTF
jgi:hypothetical protein